MIKDILNSIPVLLISIIATVTGGTAISKVAQDLQPALISDSREVQEIRVGTSTPTTTPGLTDIPNTTATPTVTPTEMTPTNTPFITVTPAKPVNASANQFTVATLAQHKSANSCYIAYKGVVYNVSAHPSWQNCMHHGTSGGRDITSTFPHATSYFSSLPKVGTLTNNTGSSSGSGTGSSSNSSNDDSHEDEDENEDEDEHEDEDEDEFEFEND